MSAERDIQILRMASDSIRFSNQQIKRSNNKTLNVVDTEADAIHTAHGLV